MSRRRSRRVQTQIQASQSPIQAGMLLQAQAVSPATQPDVMSQVQTSTVWNRRPWVSIWIKPRYTIRQLADQSPQPSVLPLATLGGVALALNYSVARIIPAYALSLPEALVLDCLLGAAGGIIGVYVLAVVLAGMSRLLGGTASVADLRLAVAWSLVPEIFGLLLWIPMIAVLGQQAFDTSAVGGFSPGQALVWLAVLLLRLILGAWLYVMLVKALAEVNRFSAWRGMALVIGLSVILYVLLSLRQMIVIVGPS
jgi:hypothetical protein